MAIVQIKCNSRSLQFLTPSHSTTQRLECKCRRFSHNSQTFQRVQFKFSFLYLTSVHDRGHVERAGVVREGYQHGHLADQDNLREVGQRDGVQSVDVNMKSRVKVLMVYKTKYCVEVMIYFINKVFQVCSVLPGDSKPELGVEHVPVQVEGGHHCVLNLAKHHDWTVGDHSRTPWKKNIFHSAIFPPS